MILAAVLSVLIGVSLGLLGGGGSILTVPILVYALGVDPKTAIATSLLVVGTTSLVAAIQHARRGNVRYRTGLIFGVAGMVGAFGGGILAGFISGTVLLLLFAAIMVATAIAMLRGRRNVEGHAPKGELPVGRIVIDGLVVGAVTGLVGAGGGFLVVPALALLGGLSMPVAIGTSLLVIALKSFAGFAGHVSHVQIDWALTGVVTGAAVAGSFAGARMVSLISPDKLRRGFAWFVLTMAAYILSNNLGDTVRGALGLDAMPQWALSLAAAGAVALVGVGVSLVQRARAAHPPAAVSAASAGE